MQFPKWHFHAILNSTYTIIDHKIAVEKYVSSAMLQG